jgi:hypothetical protein
LAANLAADLIALREDIIVVVVLVVVDYGACAKLAVRRS